MEGVPAGRENARNGPLTGNLPQTKAIYGD
jgi:hypothetical protein